VEELVEKSNGFLFEPKSIQAIREAIEAAQLLDVEDAIEYSSKSIKKIRANFTWSHIISLTIENFQRLVEKT
jgi:glycosyltransferase involved in cell wall biosynthesis